MATAATIADPASWALALLGFLARGGVLVVLLPILSMPSPVLLSMLFRGEVGMIGRGELRLIALGAGVVLSLAAIAGIVASAYADVALAERFVHDPETEGLRRWRSPIRRAGAARRSLVWWVASVQAIALLPVVAAVSLLVEGVVRTTTDELLAPSTTQVPLAARVIGAVGPEVLLAGIVVVLVEACSSLAARRLMVNAWGLAPGAPDRGSEARIALLGVARLLHTPARVLLTALVGWLIIGLVAAFAIAVTMAAWGSARDVLVEGSLATDPTGPVSGALVVALLATVWVGGLCLVGFASALRSGLWTVDALR